MKSITRIVSAAAIAGALFATSPSGALAAPSGTVPEVLPSPASGQGQIIFWRPGSLAGAAIGCGVNIGTERVSALGRGKYFLLNLEPGAYEFNAKSEAKDTLNLEVESGEVYYVKCTIRMGLMMGRPNLAPSNAAEFAAKKSNLKYVDSDDIGPRVSPDPSVAPNAPPVEQPTSTNDTIAPSDADVPNDANAPSEAEVPSDTNAPIASE